MQFLDYEKANNVLIHALGSESRFMKYLSSLDDSGAWLLVPQSVNLDGITIDQEFVETHIIYVDPEKPTHFVSKNGILGIFSVPLQQLSDSTKSLLIISLPSHINKQPQSLFTAPLFAVEKDITISKDSRANVILREGSVPIQRQEVNVILISDPIIFEGCTWQSVYQYRARSKLSSSTTESLEPKKPVPITRTQSMATVTQKSRKNAFLARVNHPSASDIVSSIKHFVQSVLKTPGSVLIQEDALMVREFLDSMEETILNHQLWRACDDSQIEETREGLEKYVTLNLHAKLFGNREEDRKTDAKINETLINLSWISFTHMEINDKVAGETESMKLACSELRKINKYKAPKDKLVCIRNCSKVVYKMLAAGTDGASGADDFLPLLIIVLIQANPPNLQSNIQYIRRFRNPSRLLEEAGYYLTQLESAVHFLLHVKPVYLKLSDKEFDLYMTGNHPSQLQEEEEEGNLSPAVALESQETETPGNGLQSDVDDTYSNLSGINNQETSTEVNHKNTTKEGTDGNEEFPISIEKLDLQKYDFMDKKVEELTIREVGKLLADYKQLARQNETLKKILLHRPFSALPSSQVFSRLDIARSTDAIGLSMDDFEAQELPTTSKRLRTSSTVLKQPHPLSSTK